MGVRDRLSDLSKVRNLGSAPLWFLEMIGTLLCKSGTMADAFHPLKHPERDSRAGHVIREPLPSYETRGHRRWHWHLQLSNFTTPDPNPVGLRSLSLRSAEDSYKQAKTTRNRSETSIHR
jgi:hypothetical protein